MVAVKAVKPTSLGFNLIPKKIKSKNGHNSVQLAAVLSPEFKLPTAELIATVKHHKTEFTYSHELKKFMKEMGIEKKEMKPLEQYLAVQVKKATKSVAVPIAMLNGYLENGITPNFSVTFDEMPLLQLAASHSHER